MRALIVEMTAPFVFSAGIGAKSKKRSEAKDLMRFLVSGAAGPTIRETGLDPLHPDVE